MRGEPLKNCKISLISEAYSKCIDFYPSNLRGMKQNRSAFTHLNGERQWFYTSKSVRRSWMYDWMCGKCFIKPFVAPGGAAWSLIKILELCWQKYQSINISLPIDYCYFKQIQYSFIPSCIFFALLSESWHLYRCLLQRSMILAEK